MYYLGLCLICIGIVGMCVSVCVISLPTRKTEDKHTRSTKVLYGRVSHCGSKLTCENNKSVASSYCVVALNGGKTVTLYNNDAECIWNNNGDLQFIIEVIDEFTDDETIHVLEVLTPSGKVLLDKR